MTIWVGALAALAAAAVVMIHALKRGVRQQIVVANPELYADSARPRLSLLRITERLLLCVRLAVILAAAVIAVITSDATPVTDPYAGTTVAVVPGVEVGGLPDEWSSSPNAVWLDTALTPLAEPPVSALVMTALRRLDASLPAGRPLTVIGDLPASNWPRQGFAMTRDVEWVAAAIARAQMPEVSAVRPTVMMIAPATRHAALRRAAEIWRQADLVDTVRVAATLDAGIPNAHWLLLPSCTDLPPSRAPGAMTAQINYDDLDPRLNASELASVLWLTLAERAADVPQASAQVAGAAFVTVPFIAQQLEPREQQSLPLFWLWLLIALLCVERVLATRTPVPG